VPILVIAARAFCLEKQPQYVPNMGCASSVDGAQTPNRDEHRTLNEFETGRVLGKGAFSVCRAAVHVATGERVAIKTVDKNSNVYNNQMMQAEMEILQLVKHPACMQLSYLFESLDSIHIVMERALGGTLQDRIETEGSLKEFAAATILTQLLDGLNHLHSLGVAHRDVKPSNILMLSNHHDSPRFNLIKLTDYGLAALECGGYEECMDMVCGTPMYAAPEMLRIAAEKCTRKYSQKVDVWSAGCTLYAMLSGASPFQEFSGRTIQMVTKIVAGDYTLTEDKWNDITSQAKTVLRSLMQLDPSIRPTAKDAKSKTKIWATASRRRERSKRAMVFESLENDESDMSFASTISHEGSLKYVANVSCDSSPRSVDMQKFGDYNCDNNSGCKNLSPSNISATTTREHLLLDDDRRSDGMETLFVLSRNAA